ncbi:MAG: hypothetical protein ACJ74O_01960 [Frankiaceae bacterium]
MPRRLVVAAAAGSALVLATATGAGASGSPFAQASYTSASAFKGHAPTIDVNVTTDGGFSLPRQVRAGFVTFRVSTPEDTYHGWQGFRLENGATVDQVIHDFTIGVAGETLEENAEGAQGLLRDATLVGGVVTTPVAPIEVTLPLERGTYYFFDLADIFNGVTPRVHALRAVGTPNWKGLPRYSQVIQTVMDGMDPRFIAPTDQHADGTYLVVNSPSDEIHEAVWRAVIPGTTDAYITQYYNAFLAGTPIARPWLDSQHGLQAMSPNRFAVIHIDLPPGQYALLCLVPSDESGLPHAYIGMHEVVTLQ